MKKIEDCLHLYLGCEIMDECNAKVGKLVGIDPFNTCPVVVQHATIWHLDYHEVKLILRPLSDMTEEEAKEHDLLTDLCYSAANKFWDRARTEAAVTSYLLKQGFDLFGLIEEGIAIDKTKL